MPLRREQIGNRIRHFIFDLGGVLLNISYERTLQAFGKLGIKDFNTHYSQAKQVGFFDHFERGEYGADDFYELVRGLSGNPLSNEEIDNAWNALFLDFPPERIHMLNDLKSRYQVFLLSNTNEIHIRAFKRLFEESHGIPFAGLFTKDYYSHLLGMRKPEEGIFMHVLEANGLQAKEVLFIDDMAGNIAGAESLGIPSLLLQQGDDVISLLRRSGVLA